MLIIVTLAAWFTLSLILISSRESINIFTEVFWFPFLVNFNPFSLRMPSVNLAAIFPLHNCWELQR